MTMDVKLDDILKRYSRKGIIHVGANSGQERFFYNSLNKCIHWIEADPNIYSELKQNIEILPKQNSTYALIHETEKKMRFNLSKQSERSSIHKFTDHHFKDENFAKLGTIEVKSTRLDSLFRQKIIDVDKFDTLITDCQGADLAVIKSLGKEIFRFKLIISEVFFEPCYQNIELACSYQDYMQLQKFRLIGEFNRRLKWSNYIFLSEKGNLPL